jgi:inner membrane protein
MKYFNWTLSASSRILIKGFIIGMLTLMLLIPTVFILNLVSERHLRQQEVAREVSSKWATAQTLTGPYLSVPYKTYYKDKDGKIQETNNHLWLLPDNFNLTGTIDHEMRERSIYKVLLYRSRLHNSGNFKLQLPKEIDATAVQWDDIKICYGLSDFKGIEERLAIKLNGKEYELSPGLPFNDIDDIGLSTSISLTAADIGKSISFDSKMKIKGSEQLHFVPLAGSSSFALTSKWPNPSFDGNNLPTERKVSDSGFSATWSFNKANLPFGTVLKDFKFDQSNIAFGVTMLEPADQYAKTSRCVKYAILFIGLTFSLFFIVELMQKKPVHPVQYVLIGLALVIFYTLLLSISEFILFDYAYLIASAGTILLITLYARGHFNNWKSAGIFGGVLTVLYGFIFILIRLEDTALLVGSIGLFIVLALVMYASRKINWYGTTIPASKS